MTSWVIRLKISLVLTCYFLQGVIRKPNFTLTGRFVPSRFVPKVEMIRTQS